MCHHIQLQNVFSALKILDTFFFLLLIKYMYSFMLACVHTHVCVRVCMHTCRWMHAMVCLWTSVDNPESQSQSSPSVLELGSSCFYMRSNLTVLTYNLYPYYGCYYGTLVSLELAIYIDPDGAKLTEVYLPLPLSAKITPNLGTFCIFLCS